ncbi:MAG: putative toxin-antitoxin system toxin component, PIN family [Rhodospirillales bacterium]|nr:putative toxin-antitoxin system toxin component, PIN family [Rhodospirillales bacterium]
MTPPRIVLDTNVLLSALLFNSGSLSWLRDAWQSELIRPLASHDTTTELIRVLSYPKFRLTDDERKDLLADYLPWCETITISEPLDVPDCRDPLDRPFLELARMANADALVSGDKDLLVLAAAFSIPILTPREFQNSLAGI